MNQLYSSTLNVRTHLEEVEVFDAVLPELGPDLDDWGGLGWLLVPFWLEADFGPSAIDRGGVCGAGGTAVLRLSTAVLFF